MVGRHPDAAWRGRRRLDRRRWPSRFSWTLMLMLAGLLLGCWNAWYWVSLEQRAIRDERDDEAGNDRQ
jgi:hypothetical protein